MTPPATSTGFTIITFIGPSKHRDIEIIDAKPANAEPVANFFPFAEKSRPEKGSFYKSLDFRYFDIRPVFQTLSIPIKLRPKLNDTTKSSASASFNVGLAYGIKFTKNRFNRYYNDNGSGKASLNDVTRKWTFTPGGFAGPTIVDLKSANTSGLVKKD